MRVVCQATNLDVVIQLDQLANLGTGSSFSALIDRRQAIRLDPQALQLHLARCQPCS
jgi:hypothetical protein